MELASNLASTCACGAVAVAMARGRPKWLEPETKRPRHRPRSPWVRHLGPPTLQAFVNFLKGEPVPCQRKVYLNAVCCAGLKTIRFFRQLIGVVDSLAETRLDHLREGRWRQSPSLFGYDHIPGTVDPDQSGSNSGAQSKIHVLPQIQK